jgi:O-antigen/teichoic acid export membrane protein
MGRHTTPSGIRAVTAVIRASGTTGPVAATAGFNVGAAVASALASAVVARALGPSLRGEYAAVTAWFSLVLLVGGMGQPAALCYYVASQPRLARGYVATSRTLMIITGSLALVTGLAMAPVLGHGSPSLLLGYRVAFFSSIIGFVGTSYTFALQARSPARWNVSRTIQPVLGLVAVCVLWAWHRLSLDTSLVATFAAMVAQFTWAYHMCHRERMAPGRARRRLARPLAAYGIAQMASLAPATLNASLDQLVLSQLVPAADLGRYAVAVSITSLPLPLVSAIGYIAFPRLAARDVISRDSQRLLRIAVLVSGVVAAAVLVPVAAAATWLVPLVFGGGYHSAVPLLWLLTPGGVFIACGQVAGDLLRGRRNLSVVASSQWLAAIATVALLCALLPTLGVAGAAIASTVAYGIALATMVRALWRLPRQPAAQRPGPAAAEPAPVLAARQAAASDA